MSLAVAALKTAVSVMLLLGAGRGLTAAGVSLHALAADVAPLPESSRPSASDTDWGSIWASSSTSLGLAGLTGMALTAAAALALSLRRQRSRQRTTLLELQACEERFSTLMSASPLGIALVRLHDGAVLQANEMLLRIADRSRDEVVGQDWTRLLDATDLEQVRAAFAGQGEARETGATLTTRSGERRDLLVSVERVELGGTPHALLMMGDITRPKRAENALRDSEQRLRLIYENSAEGMILTAPGGRLFSANPAACRMLGRTEEQLLQAGRSAVMDCTDPSVAPALARMDEPGYSQAELALVRGDGTRFQAEVTCATFETPDGQLRTSMLFRDLSERRKMQEALRESEEQLRQLHANLAEDVTHRAQIELERDRLYSAIEQSGETVVITDTRGRILYVNPAFESLTGYTRQEALGQNPKILKSGIQDQAYYSNLWDTISSGRVWRGQFVNRKKDGSLFTEQACISPVRDHVGEITSYVAVKRNISRELELEDQLQQARKMESVGRLAGGVAHDFNNMLSVIIGRADLALGRRDVSSELESTLQEIRKAALHSADITRQLLAFARKQTIAPEVLSLNDAVERTLKMLRRLIGENIELTWLPAGELWTVRIDPAQVDQIMANLAVNARDAISGVGKVTIATGNVVLDGTTMAMGEKVPAGPYVMLCVSDDGCGMGREVLERAFEPFFTTKTLGRGTGLGLATVYGIVKQNHGFVDVHSEPDKGTAFEIYLPRTTGESVSERPSRPEELPEGTGTVLLVEDEAMILDFTATALKGLGYTVLAASTPGEALRIARDHAKQIRLLITDVVMPEMSGRDLADELATIIPDLKRLYMSGYTSDILQDDVLRDESRFLQKPFTIGALAVKVSNMLRQPSE